MDERLVAWARAVKARRRLRGPVLFLLLDDRLADPVGAVRGLLSRRADRALFAVVLRSRDGARRRALARALAAPCRRAGIVLLVASDPALARAVGAGEHRSGRARRAGRPDRSRRPVSASAHDRRGFRRAAREGAGFCLVSPVFPTASHPGAVALGVHRFAAIARGAPAAMRVLALGGIDGRTARRLPPCAAGAGAITALAPAPPSASRWDPPGRAPDRLGENGSGDRTPNPRASADGRRALTGSMRTGTDRTG